MNNRHFDHLVSDHKNKDMTLETFFNHFFQGIKHEFPESDIAIYTYSKLNETLKPVLPLTQNKYMSPKEIRYVTKIHAKKSNRHLNFIKYLINRDKNTIIDQSQLKKDQTTFQYSCKDGLYLNLTKKNTPYSCIVFIHHWKIKKSVFYNKNKTAYIFSMTSFLESIQDFFHTLMHTQNLSNNFLMLNHLNKASIEKETKIQNLSYELTILKKLSFEASSKTTSLEIIKLSLKFLNIQIPFNTSSVLMFNNHNDANITIQLNSFITSSQKDILINSLLKHSYILYKKLINSKQTKVTIIKNQSSDFSSKVNSNKNIIKTTLNFPLTFEKKVIGILNLSHTSIKEVSESDIELINTICNDLASHLHRIQNVKKSETLKINSLLKSMTDGILISDTNHSIIKINEVGKKLLSELSIEESPHNLTKLLNKLAIYETYKTVISTQKPQITTTKPLNKTFSIQINPLHNTQLEFTGTVVILRDFTEVQKINRIKSQRLDIMSKVALIINSISNLNNLLSVLMEFYLNITQSEMGSFQLKQGTEYLTTIHANFPDKIRKQYRFLDNTSLSDHTIETQKLLFIANYPENSSLNPSTKITIDHYICIPIMVKQNLIGIINIARKPGVNKSILDPEDLETLKTITVVSGSAIHNAMLYEESLKKDTLKKELQIAYNIQKEILPSSAPKFGEIDIGTLSKPARDIGGDYYDFIPLDQDNLGIIIADIVGKGIPAGLFMAMLKSTLHSNIKNLTSPKKALEKLNLILYEDKTVSKFIPLFYGVLNKKTAILTYSNAGHEPGLVLKNQKFFELDTLGYPIGAFKQSYYEEKTILLSLKSVCMFFTDGIIESKNRSGEQFGLNNLKDLMKKKQTF